MNLFSKLAHLIMGWFTSPPVKQFLSEAQAALTVAQQAASGAIAVAAVMGEPDNVTAEIGKIADGLKVASSAITAESSAATLTQQAQALNGLVTNLVTSGDIGIKNASTKAAVSGMAQKVAGVVGVLEAGAAAPATA